MPDSDVALERVITEITAAIVATADSRFAILQRLAIGMRSESQVRRMERGQRLTAAVTPVLVR